MFNSELKARLQRVEDLQTLRFESLLVRVRQLEQDFQLLLSALNMEIREESVWPRHILSRPAPEAHYTYGPEPASPAPPTTKRRKKGKR